MAIAGHGARRLRRFAAVPTRAAARLGPKTPERLLIAPQDIRTSDPTIAADIVAGYFAFGGKIVNAHGRSPFAIETGTDPEDGLAWARQLCGFGWLRHLRAADAPESRQKARELVTDFMATHARPSSAPAWEPAIAGRRMLAWLSQSPVVLDGADRDFYLRFMQGLNLARTHLERVVSSGLTGNDRLLASLALAEYGLCVQGAPAFQRRGSQALASELDQQVLPDGGHVSRNPQALIDLLLDLLPLRQAYAARGIQAPQQVLNAIDRMMPMLRLFRHGDGSLALFNGMGVTAPELVATILAYDDARGQAIANAPYAGYQRLEGGSTLAIVDTGAKPPSAFSLQAHAGCLSFELSSGRQRIVVNCGAPDGTRAEAREAARMTAAHSTLVIDDTSSCRFAGGDLKRWLGDQILSGPNVVRAERVQDGGIQGGDVGIEATHDGYAERFGLAHSRRLILSHDGHRLEGIDRLNEAAKRRPQALPYVARFHLHPSIRPSAQSDRNVEGDGDSAGGEDHGTQIRLDALDGETWLFEVDAPAVIEPSVLFAASGGPRPTRQIKVAANSGIRQTLRWSFRRL